ncbi:nucleotidyltransferase family protein [Candidatus Woesearchaeota archaeon]|nr:nucleotidyltransferase family protein [Candidatus Woesearchaeota archaeon]
MKNAEQIQSILTKHKDYLRKKYNVKELGVFGSYVRGQQKQSSDIDLLVDFEESIGLFQFIKLEEHLTNLLGIKVDLVTRNALKPRIGQCILKEVVTV